MAHVKHDINVKKLAYIAGFVDGEGCIRAAGRGLNLQVSVTNTVRAPLLFTQEVFGGSIKRRKVAGKRVSGKDYKPQWTWLICGEPAAAALLSLLPYLIVKKREAIVGIALTAAHGQEKVDVAVELRLLKL